MDEVDAGLMNKTITTFTVKDVLKCYLGYILVKAAITVVTPRLRAFAEGIKDYQMDEELKDMTSQE